MKRLSPSAGGKKGTAASPAASSPPAQGVSWKEEQDVARQAMKLEAQLRQKKQADRAKHTAGSKSPAQQEDKQQQQQQQEEEYDTLRREMFAEATNRARERLSCTCCMMHI